MFYKYLLNAVFNQFGAGEASFWWNRSRNAAWLRLLQRDVRSQHCVTYFLSLLKHIYKEIKIHSKGEKFLTAVST
jgi:hypothetical protein